MNLIKKYLCEILLGVIIILISGLYVIQTYYYFANESSEQIVTFQEEVIDEESVEEVPQISNKMYVDLKGAVKKPGVYEITNNTIINDVINMAGGFNTNAYTKNINLSKKLVNETVIYVYTKYEYSLLNAPEEEEEKCVCPQVDISTCISSGSSVIESNKESNSNQESQSEVKTLINVNTATKEELMTLNGIGEAKAQSIIEYRTSNGNFNSIEDIKKVSGISDNLYEKIKEDITI